MSELIDKSDISKRLCAACYNMGSFACISCVIPHIIKDIPTIEPEVRHGRWIDWSMWNESRYQCSECNCEMKYKTNFCPRCGAEMLGAEMRGGADNADN